MNVVVVEEDDDPQTKFYKQHMKRSERPPIDGRTTIYNFDEWTKECITKSFARQQDFKEYQKREQHFVESERETKSMLGGIFAIFIIIGIYVVSMSLYDDETKPSELDSTKKSKG